MLKLIKILFFLPGPQYSWKKVVLVLILSSITLSGSAVASYLFYSYAKDQQIAYATDTVQAIIQTTPQTGVQYAPLQTAYLAEVLALSADCPTKLCQFDLHDAKRRLLATNIIKDVRLKKIKPDILFIHYSIRAPLAYLEDYSNTAIDEEGVIFHYSPFYPPRHLPCLYLGKNDPLCPWGGEIKQEHLMLIEKLFTLLGREKIKRIDISQIDANSAGKRELTIIFKEGSILRLAPKNYVQQLANYSILKNTILKESTPTIIDLRISDVAYLYPNSLKRELSR
jgi:hypothetical protein